MKTYKTKTESIAGFHSHKILGQAQLLHFDRKQICGCLGMRRVDCQGTQGNYRGQWKYIVKFDECCSHRITRSLPMGARTMIEKEWALKNLNEGTCINLNGSKSLDPQIPFSLLCQQK